MSSKPKPKPFTEYNEVPSDPTRILRGVAETPAEIAKRTGLRLDRVCESIEKWVRAGHIFAGRIACSYCSIPVFRVKLLWDK